MKKTICLILATIILLFLIAGCSNVPVTNVTKIRITSMPLKTTYLVNEKLDLSGLAVECVFSDGTTSIIKSYTTNPQNGSLLETIGITEVVISYEGKTTSFSVTVARPKWCVISYIDFSTLGVAAIFNLDEICQTTPNENVKAYFLTGGADADYSISDYPYLSKAIQPFNISNPFSASSIGNTYQLWEYTSDGKFKELSWQSKGMNDPNVLIQLIENCTIMAKTSDPYAEYRYILELWNHGGGSYVGLIRDNAISQTSNEKVLMSLSDCGEAINTVARDSKIKFEAIIFDMCLMQSIETAHTISSEFTNYIIGSEASSSVIGSAYKDWFDFLYNNPTATGKEFGICFCESAYQKVVKYGDVSCIENFTWSVLDMSKLKDVENAYEIYIASYLNNLPVETVENILDEIGKLPAFSNGFWSQYMYDINAFTSFIGDSGARNTLLNAINNAIIYKKNGLLQASANICGLSMCILTDTSNWKEWKFSSQWNNSYLSNCLTNNYRGFQNRIANGL